ncbi:MAG: hypothetical protein WCV79_00615 [Candidatus Paceibacterota bacterium]
MLSIFPALLSYQQLGPFLIRLTLGAILILWTYRGLRNKNGDTKKKVLDSIGGLIGVFLVLGLWTQVAAGLAAVGLLVCIIGKIKSKAFLTDGVNYVLILFILAVTLLVMGAGAFAIDYPL